VNGYLAAGSAGAISAFNDANRGDGGGSIQERVLPVLQEAKAVPQRTLEVNRRLPTRSRTCASSGSDEEHALRLPRRGLDGYDLAALLGAVGLVAGGFALAVWVGLALLLVGGVVGARFSLPPKRREDD
jgi:hypothetical protein